MSNYPGFYYYQKPVSCSACVDTPELYGGVNPDCRKCREFNRVKVKVLQFSSRLFRHDAIVQHLDSGKIEAVPIRYLTFVGDGDVQTGV